MKRNSTPNILLTNTFLLISGMFICGLISIYFGKELNWDLASYHYYNPYAFLNQRWKIDYWPSSFVHVHFTPTLDLFTYFLIHSLPVKSAVFIMGALDGINFWLLFNFSRMTLAFFPRVRYPHLLAIFLAALGLFGPTVLPGIGSFQDDDLVSLFILGFVNLQFIAFKTYLTTRKISIPLMIISSIILGLGFGCKLTTGIFIGGSLCAYLFLSIPVRDRIKIITLFSLGVIMGLLLSSGYWMLFLWEKYYNPFFPLWNNIFRSPNFPFYNWHDARFLPQGWMQTLFYPFYFSWDGRTGDGFFQDFRYAILYVLFVCYAGKLLKQKWRHEPRHSLPLSIKWLFLLIIFSYVLCQCYFSIMRYIVVLEMLAPLIIYLLLYQLIHSPFERKIITTLVFYFMVITMIPIAMVRADWYETDYFNIKLPAFIKQTPEALVLMPFSAYALNTLPRPQTYLIPSFPKAWCFIGIPFLRDQYEVPQEVLSRVRDYPGKNIYLLSSPAFMPKMFEIARAMGLNPQKNCSVITSDRQRVTHESVWLCAAKI